MPIVGWDTQGPYTRLGVTTLKPRGEFASGLGPSADKMEPQDRAANDPRLAPTSRAVDRGVVLPNFNDGFRGAAPDLGCCELGAPLPHFGPRPPGGPS